MGFLLVLYGTVSLWLGKTSSATSATKQRLCALLLCTPENADSPTSVENPPDESLRQARVDLLLDPASAYKWADLANAEINADHLDRAKFCIRQAVAAAPGNPAILFHAASFYLRLQEYPETLQYLGSVLRNPDLAAFYDRVFALYAQMDLSLTDLLNQGLPHTPEAANGFLRYWINQNKLEEAQETWTWINKNSLTSLQSTGSYVTLLAKDGNWDQAMQSWMQNTAQLFPNYGKTDWIYDGSFESAPVDCPFDWHLVSGPLVQVERDTESGFKGSASLRLRYTGTPKDSDPQAYQTVLLTPGKWQIKASMKTLGLQGVMLRVVDAEDATRLDASTPTTAHIQEWTTVSATFQVNPTTRLAKVEIMTPPARDSGLLVVGTVWVDAVTLTPVTSNLGNFTDQEQPSSKASQGF